MIRTFITKHGEIYYEISADSATVDLNTPEGSIYLDNPLYSTTTDYYENGMWYSIGEPPSPHHVFDYAFKYWVDPRTLDEIKSRKWQEIKKQRDALEFGGFLFGGLICDSDQVSQGRILGAMLAGQSQTWTTSDNSTIELTAEQLKSLYAALQMHVAVAHERGRIAREAIQAATTKEQIEAIVF